MEKEKKKWYEKKGLLYFLLIFIWPVGLFGLIKNKNMTTSKKIILFLVFLVWGIFTLINISNSEESSDVKDFSPTPIAEGEKSFSSSIPPSTYEILNTENLSIKALGNRSLSEYTTKELNELPENRKIEFRILVPNTIKENQVIPTIEKIVQDVTNKEREIDELILFLYSDESLASGMYDVATAVWAPGGKLGNVTAKIARENIRTNYFLEIQIKENLEKYLSQRDKKETKFGLSEEERRKAFIEFVAAENKAMQEADKRFPIVAGASMEDLQKNAAYADELTERYSEEIRLRYNITKDQDMQITIEAFEEGWPMK